MGMIGLLFLGAGVCENGQKGIAVCTDVASTSQVDSIVTALPQSTTATSSKH